MRQKRVRSRSREFSRERNRSESQVIDLEQEREARRLRREEQLKNDKRYQKRLEQERREESRAAGKAAGKTRTEQERLRLRRVRFGYAAILVLFAVLLGIAGWKAMQVKAAEAAAAAREAELQQLRQALLEEMQRTGTREYVEDRARSELHMIFPGETLYLFKEEP